MIERLLPAAASAHATALDAVLNDVHWHMLAIFVLWLVVLVVALVRFRERRAPAAATSGTAVNGAPAGAHRGASTWFAVIAIGAVVIGDSAILLTRALPAWFARIEPPPASPLPPFEVHVTAEQFAWNIQYPGPDGRFGHIDSSLISAANPVGIDRTDPAAQDDIGLLNILMLPIGRTVVIQLTSRDVVHSFTLPEMRVKQDAVPGMPARTWFTPVQLGDWEIVCSQLCGLGHYRMRGEYHVVTHQAWEEWQKEELARLEP